MKNFLFTFICFCSASVAMAQGTRLIGTSTESYYTIGYTGVPGYTVTDSSNYIYSGSNGSLWNPMTYQFTITEDTAYTYTFAPAYDSAGTYYDREIYTRDAMGQLTSFIRQQLVNGNYVNIEVAATSYNLQGVPTFATDYIYSATGVLKLLDITTYNTLGAPSLIKNYNYFASGVFKELTVSNYSYNNNNKLLEVNTRSYYDTTAAPDGASIGRTHYNSAQLPDSVSTWKVQNNVQQLTYCTLHSYDANGNDTLMDTYNLYSISTSAPAYSDTPALTSRIFRHYDASNNVERALIYYGLAGTGAPGIQLETYTYNGNRILTDTISSINSAGVASAIYATDYIYTGTDMTVMLQQTFQTGVGAQSGTYGRTRTAFTYNSDHSPTLVEISNSNDGINWTPSYSNGSRINYYYEPVPTGIPNTTLLSGVKLWPVPAHDNIEISLDDKAFENAATVQLYDVNGRLLQTSTLTGRHTGLSVAGLATGSYIISVSGNGKHFEQLVQKL